MAELLTAAGIVFILAIGAWYLGSALLRAAAAWCFVGAGLLLALSGQGDVSPWAGPAMMAWGMACWTLGSACIACAGAGGAHHWPPGCSRDNCCGGAR
jgi:hypothetical protein